VRLDDAAAVRGRSVLVIEDGPTITHGGLPHGAGFAAARAAGAVEIVDPRPWAAPAIRPVFHRHRHIGPVLPAVGYDAAQLEDLRRTIDDTPAEVVVIATPIDLGALIEISKPTVRARYDYVDAGVPTLGHIVDDFLLDLPAQLRAAGRLETRPS
jgi:predicted GTPase